MTGTRLPRLAEGLACVLALILALALFSGAAMPVLAPAALAGLVAWITCQDAASFTIPDGAVAALAVVAVGVRLAEGEAALHGLGATVRALGVDGVVCGVSLFCLREAFYRRRGYDGLGLGDVKLAVAGGLLIGAEGFAWALCTASALALAFVLARAALRKGLRATDRLAFGAYLAPAILTVWVAGQAAPPAAWPVP